MEKINFSNGEKISAAKVTIDNVDYEVTPAVYDGATPLNATVFNNMQENIEDAIDTKANTSDVYTKQEVDNLIPTKAHQINVGVDTEYRVNLLKSENILNPNLYVDNQYTNITSGGTEETPTNNNYWRTGKQRCLPNTTYSFNVNSINYVCFYQKYGTPISVEYNVTTSFTTPANCYYVQMSWAKSAVAFGTDVMINEGSTATEYTPFINNQINVDNEKYSDTINVGATEDSRSRVNVLHSRNLFNKNSAPVLQAYVDNSQVGNSTNARTTYIPCKPNTTYTIQKRNDGTYNRFVVATTTTIPANGVATAQYINNNDASSITLTTNSTAKYLVVQFYHINETIYTEQQALDSIMINEGLTALPYEPYIVPSIKVDNEEIYAKPEIGTNENGSYIKYANGLMICSGVKSFTGTNFTTQNGAVYIPASSPSINFAQQFIENPVVTLTAFNRANGVYESGLSTSLVAIWPFAFSSISNVNYSIHYIAIGRWK